PRELRKLGAHVDVAEAYQTVMPASSRRRLVALLRDSKCRPNVVTFTSSSTVRNFVALLGRRSAPLDTPLLGGVRFASIGPVTSATLRDFRLTPHIEAREYTVAGLIEAICRSVAAEH